jgi:hypothetical protein
MAGVLDLLQAYLQRMQPGGTGYTPVGGRPVDPNAPQPPMDWGAGSRKMTARDAADRAALPPGLPEPVARSILNQPSYGEGEGGLPMAPAVPGMGQEIIDNMLAGSPQRDAYLAQQLAQARENQWRQRMGLPVGGSGTQFASPLNQMMPRWGSQSMGL